MLADCHIHSCYSFDGSPDATPEALCEAAIRAGLSCIAVTDHLDVNCRVEQIYPEFDDDAAFSSLLEAKEKYRGKVDLLLGIELGQPCEYPETAEAVLKKHAYDFVLGSIHNLPKVPDFYYLSYKDMPQALIEQLFDRALTEEIALCDFPSVSSLAHLTYLHRYLLLAGRELDFSKFEDRLKFLFRKLIEKGIALELNVSLLRKGLSAFMPTEELLKLYRDTGGILVTVGSDAHCLSHVGSHISDGYQLLSSLGFRYVTIFKEQKPLLYRI